MPNQMVNYTICDQVQKFRGVATTPLVGDVTQKAWYSTRVRDQLASWSPSYQTAFKQWDARAFQRTAPLTMHIREMYLGWKFLIVFRNGKASSILTILEMSNLPVMQLTIMPSAVVTMDVSIYHRRPTSENRITNVLQMLSLTYRAQVMIVMLSSGYSPRHWNLLACLSRMYYASHAKTRSATSPIHRLEIDVRVEIIRYDTIMLLVMVI